MMTLEALLFLLTAAPLTEGPSKPQAELASVNEVANGKPAIASFSCNDGTIHFQLQWPVALETPTVDVAVGSSSETDAAMGPPTAWKTLTQADRETLVAPVPGADITTATGKDEYLLLQVSASHATGTAQFKAEGVKAAFEDVVAQCPEHR